MKLKLSYIICAVLVPLVMILTLALLVSVLQFKQDVALSAKTLLRFSEDVSTASWRVTGQAVKLADRPCAEILSELNRTRAFTPYIRDIEEVVSAYNTLTLPLCRQNGHYLYYLREPNMNLFLQCLNPVETAVPKCITIKERY